MSPTATKTARPAFRCSDCGWTTAKWVGRCGECQAWGTVEEGVGASAGARAPAALAPSAPARPISDVDVEAARARSTGVGELDRVLGGGIVPGAVVLLAGEPGVGKSTLLLDVAAKAAAVSAGPADAGPGGPVLYVTGEESAGQVRLRAERIGALTPHLLLAAETDLATLLGHVDNTGPSLLVVDSVQTIADSTVDGAAGGTSQVRAVASALIHVAKTRGIPVLLVGHVTKDGSIAGPRVLEHLVDVVCQFEGDRHSRLRMVRAVKNRYGPTDEVGCFDLSDTGITGLADPSGLFLSGQRSAVPGTCVTVTLEGRRPMPTEIQALVAPSPLGSPRRTTSGLDSSRVSMTLAVLQSRLGVSLANADVYVSTVGGARAVEPAVDLAVALAVLSSGEGKAIDQGVVAMGEVGLTGEVRSTVGVQRRLAEAARLGFTHALVPAHGAADLKPVPGLIVRPVSNLHEAALAAWRVGEPVSRAEPGGVSRPTGREV
ncbi:DNA repair protein RadA [Georgenia yuyongxinii]|uniref:DNA repair protein RadA n=1 Tax=Georgenia yuyongxinii TaxID=2589797 RepID=A0A552WPZ2_9MICO|nr:DNA repair protein RadA [Georgenia yuyongxinii]TRW44744.1 DNA repair protein RadA [Georgenia yuyongxinii]